MYIYFILTLSSGASSIAFSLFINVGKDGPYMSASNTPTLLPYCYKANARFIATVDFPTPPLQLLTAIIFFTFSSVPRFLKVES